MIAAALAAGGCTWARPVSYGLPPGISASFAPSERQLALDFEKMFCTVLEAEFGAEWEPCNKYVHMPQAHAPQAFAGMPTDFTVLQLGGFGAQCVINVAETFGDAAEHLRTTHAITAIHVPLGAFDSSESNAVLIRDFIQARDDNEKFVVLAHSKGAADLMVAFATYPSELAQIKAVVTVAGAVGGSWLVDRIPGVIGEILEAIGGTSCPRQVAAVANNAVESMRRATRQEFLASLGIESAGLDRLIRAGYHLLGLQTYFTAGEQEVRAWTIHQGDTAPKAAAVIHTDFERGFIRAETVGFEDFVSLGGWKPAREQGAVRSEGKEYVVQDGDVMLFRFNV